MKKTIIAISSLMILTLFIIVTVNAQSNDPKASKANSELKKNVSDDAAINNCQGMKGIKMVGCFSGGCSAMNCDAAKCKGGKCDPDACKGGNCDQGNCVNGKCGQTAQRSNCRSTTGMMSGPMNCSRDLVVASK